MIVTIRPMTIFMAERYIPNETDVVVINNRLRRVVVDLRAEGIYVTYLGSTLVPDDEMSFSFFEGPSTEAIAEMHRRAGVTFDRIVLATQDWNGDGLVGSELQTRGTE